jgi:hypothetical protein
MQFLTCVFFIKETKLIHQFSPKSRFTMALNSLRYSFLGLSATLFWGIRSNSVPPSPSPKASSPPLGFRFYGSRLIQSVHHVPSRNSSNFLCGAAFFNPISHDPGRLKRFWRPISKKKVKFNKTEKKSSDGTRKLARRRQNFIFLVSVT